MSNMSEKEETRVERLGAGLEFLKREAMRFNLPSVAKAIERVIVILREEIKNSYDKGHRH
ncbi:hypothetical protein AAC691_16985 [Nguyenibacter vanlangensis]|uniref:Uncharacterized protein n=1 Tax=Nguyenibacter vanlangensis TaxID=1216886 RepID=A0ABZ3D2H5_9PROT